MAIRMAKDPAFREQQAAYKKNYNRRKKAEVQALIDDFRRDGCQACSEKDPCCLSAHHLRNKRFTISSAWSGGWSLEEVKAELRKCVCLCENCHRKLHAGIQLAIRRRLRR